METEKVKMLHDITAPERNEDLVSDSKVNNNREQVKQLIHNDKRVQDMTDVELATIMNREISEYTDDVSVSVTPEKFDSVSIEITPCQTEDLEMDYMESQANQNVINDEGEESVSDSNKHSGTLNIPSESFRNKNDSHSTSAHQGNASKDEKPEPGVLADPKRSILSPIPRRSVQLKSDFASIQMPEDDKSSILQNEDSWIRVAIPYLPTHIAVLCLLLNIVIPGSGTIVSGFCILCCARPRVPPKYDQDFVLLLCTNTLVGLAQLFTVTFLLVGWFWSVAWGIRMLTLSFEYKQKLNEERLIRLKERAINAFKKKW